jgi:hypothetical protein
MPSTIFRVSPCPWTTEFPPTHVWKSVLVQLANANASLEQYEPENCARVLTSQPAHYKQNPHARHWRTKAKISRFVLTSVLTRPNFERISRPFTYEKRRGREWHRRPGDIDEARQGSVRVRVREKANQSNPRRPGAGSEDFWELRPALSVEASAINLVRPLACKYFREKRN